MKVICPYCKNEFDDYWGWELSTGRRKLIICNECYQNATQKVIDIECKHKCKTLYKKVNRK